MNVKLTAANEAGIARASGRRVSLPPTRSKHAHARRVEVDIRYDHDEFRLRVRDDGKGIDPAVLSAQGSEGHYGLRGMPERATLIGGNLTVWSDVNAGTELELRVPGSAAYATAPRRFSLSRKLARRMGLQVGKRS